MNQLREPFTFTQGNMLLSSDAPPRRASIGSQYSSRSSIRGRSSGMHRLSDPTAARPCARLLDPSAFDSNNSMRYDGGDGGGDSASDAKWGSLPGESYPFVSIPLVYMTATSPGQLLDSGGMEERQENRESSPEPEQLVHDPEELELMNSMFDTSMAVDSFSHKPGSFFLCLGYFKDKRPC